MRNGGRLYDGFSREDIFLIPNFPGDSDHCIGALIIRLTSVDFHFQ